LAFLASADRTPARHDAFILDPRMEAWTVLLQALND
jgi:hypothetical protein